MTSHADDLPFSIEATPLATVITNPRLHDNPIVAVNDAFCLLTGYSAREVLGRNCRLLSGDGTEAFARGILRSRRRDPRWRPSRTTARMERRS